MNNKRKYQIHIITPPDENGIASVKVKFLDKPLTLEENQRIVGGNIELVKGLYKGRSCDILINEEGLNIGLPYNSIATEYHKDLYRGWKEYDQEQIEGLGLVGVAILMVDHDLK